MSAVHGRISRVVIQSVKVRAARCCCVRTTITRRSCCTYLFEQGCLVLGIGTMSRLGGVPLPWGITLPLSRALRQWRGVKKSRQDSRVCETGGTNPHSSRLWPHARRQNRMKRTGMSALLGRTKGRTLCLAPSSKEPVPTDSSKDCHAPTTNRLSRRAEAEFEYFHEPTTAAEFEWRSALGRASRTLG